VTFHYPCPSCDATVDVEFTPATHPKYGIGPDHPAWSDPGDNGELDLPAACPACTEPLDEKAAWYWCEAELRNRNEPDL